MNPVVIIFLLVAVILVVWVVRMAGWRFAANRFAQAVLIIVLVTFSTTALLRLVPGDACLTALGTGANEESVAACRDDRKLDENVFIQYGDWVSKVGNVTSPDLGLAYYKQGIPLTDIIKERAPRTGWLFLYSQTIGLLISVPIAIWSAYQAGRRPRSWVYGAGALAVGIVLALAIAGVIAEGPVTFGILLVIIPLYAYMLARGGGAADTTFNLSAFVLLSVPVFVIGESLRYWFSVKKDYYNLVGYKGWKGTDGWQVLDHFGSVWLPALVLGLAVSPVYLRLLRADMVQNLQQDFVTVAKAKGLPNWRILLRHVLRPSSLTLLTVAGLNISQLVNGAVVVEFIFDLDGMGSYLIEAVAAREYFPVQTIVALVAVLFVAVNTLVDVVYTAVDPRVTAGDD